MKFTISGLAAHYFIFINFINNNSDLNFVSYLLSSFFILKILDNCVHFPKICASNIPFDKNSHLKFHSVDLCNEIRVLFFEENWILNVKAVCCSALLKKVLFFGQLKKKVQIYGNFNKGWGGRSTPPPLCGIFGNFISHIF